MAFPSYYEQKAEAEAYGAYHPDEAWILNDFDVWFKNPYYNGPPVRHPEEDNHEEEENLPDLSQNEEEDMPF